MIHTFDSVRIRTHLSPFFQPLQAQDRLHSREDFRSHHPPSSLGYGLQDRGSWSCAARSRRPVSQRCCYAREGEHGRRGREVAEGQGRDREPLEASRRSWSVFNSFSSMSIAVTDDITAV